MTGTARPTWRSPFLGNPAETLAGADILVQEQ